VPALTLRPHRGCRGGFTLIELIVVVIIVGLVYALAIGTLKRTTEPSENLSLNRLAEYMQEQHDHNHLALVCTQRCSRCGLYADGKSVRDVAPFVDSRTEFYRFDYRTGSQKLEWPALYDDEGREEEVCFRYDLYPDGSSTEMMVRTQEGVYDFAGIFGGVTRYASLQEAINAKQERLEEVRQ